MAAKDINRLLIKNQKEFDSEQATENVFDVVDVFDVVAAAAGPVVAAAVIAPSDLAGIVDSKKITKEEEREVLYEQLVAMKDIQWAVSVIDATRIDKINILQATLEGMRFAAEALVVGDETSSNDQVSIQKVKEASIELTGCYVVCPTSTSTSVFLILPV